MLIHETRATDPDRQSYLLAPPLVLGSGETFSTPNNKLRANFVSINSEDDTANVEVITQPFVEPARCNEIRNEISQKRAEIEQLQEELRGASTQEKPRIAAQIRKLQAEIAALRAEG